MIFTQASQDFLILLEEEAAEEDAEAEEASAEEDLIHLEIHLAVEVATVVGHSEAAVALVVAASAEAAASTLEI